MIVVDASALIAHLESGDAHHETAGEALLELADRPLGASTITLAEVLVGPARAGRTREAQSVLASLGVRELTLAADAVTCLAVLQADTSLKMPDCCVLLAARESLATGLLTFDDGLASAARALGVSVFGAD